MRAHNISYDTLVKGNCPAATAHVTSPLGHVFVTAEVHEGILPRILTDLLQARARAKEDLKRETDPDRRLVLNARQLALKLSANSIYGFVGAGFGGMLCVEVAGSVTAYGRHMIVTSKEICEEHFTEAHGYEGDAQVIYGDTGV